MVASEGSEAVGVADGGQELPDSRAPGHLVQVVRGLGRREVAALSALAGANASDQ